ncbi:hypothetical protein GPALN_006124 [Globodera pallida]|nr:hypothetical protein GPALN_006124 [Globodera pallida]
MERLLFRARALPALSAMPDHQLPALLAHSDPQPERVSPNVILFQRGERLCFWYLLLSGQVQLYLDNPQHPGGGTQLRLVCPGTFFGELRTRADATHCCSAKVVQTADFVRIELRPFRGLVQCCMVPMEELVAEVEQNVPGGDEKLGLGWPPKQIPREAEHLPKRRPPPEARQRRERHSPKHQTNGTQLFELGLNHSSIDNQILRAASQLREAISGTDTGPISGSELCKRLRALCAQWLPELRQPFSPLMLQGMCQTLLDRVLLVHVRTEHALFRDSSTARYRWLPSSRTAPMSPLDCPSTSSALLLLALIAADTLFQHILQKPPDDRTPEELELVFEELSHIRAFGHMSRSMKCGLARLICWECREHAGTVIFREGDPGQSWFVLLRGTLEAKAPGKRHSLLQEGDDFGKLALLSNCDRSQRQSTVTTAEDGCQLLSVDATEFNRLLCEMETSTESDVNDNDMALDVLVLQRDAGGRHWLIAGLPSKILEYTLETRIDHLAEMCGQPTVGTSSSGQADSLLQDVLLSLPLWMPSNKVCNMLKLYYCFGTSNSVEPGPTVDDLREWTRTTSTATKRRTVAFVRAWQATAGHRFFLDSVANAFVEELFSCVLEDARTAEDAAEGRHLEEMVRQMEALMELREKSMQRLSRLPRTVLDKGMYAEDAPAPEPVLPVIEPNRFALPGNQTVHCASGNGVRSVTLQLRMDKSAAEIAQMALTAWQAVQHSVHRPAHLDGDSQQQNGRRAFAEKAEEKTGEVAGVDELVLVEMRPGEGETAMRQFEANECSVPTMVAQMDANQLFVARRSELYRLIPPAEPPLPSARPQCLLLGPIRMAKAMALHHFKLLAATSDSELLVQVVGRDHFPPALAPSNLDLLLRRFHLVQCWTGTELLLAPPQHRLAVLQALIELAEHAFQQKDLLSLFAITLGLSHLPVARLHSLWAQLPNICRHRHFRSQFLLAPARNHRNYRLLAQQLRPPFVPFVPVILKELSFVHGGRNSCFGDGLINFEKMHLIAQVLRSFRLAKGEQCHGEAGEATSLGSAIARLAMGQARTDEALIRNLHAVEDQRRLMRVSLAVHPQGHRPVPSISDIRCDQITSDQPWRNGMAE